MPNCVVKGCKNHSSKTKRQDGITFHTLELKVIPNVATSTRQCGTLLSPFIGFPVRYINVKEKWIEVIRVSRNEPSWNPTVRSVVCSTHFENDDLYYTKKGLRRVLRNGYPKHLPAAPDQSANIDLNEPTFVYYAHVPATPIESIDVDPIQPHTLQAHVPATPIESIDVNPIQPHTLQAHGLATTIESIDVDPIQPHTLQAHVPATPIESIDVDLIQPHTIQAHLSTTPVLSTTSVICNMEEERESIFDTPRKCQLRKRIFLLENQQTHMKKKIKTLNQKVRRLKKRNRSLREILDHFKNQNYIDTDLYNSINGNIAVIDLFNAINRKIRTVHSKIQRYV